MKLFAIATIITSLVLSPVAFADKDKEHKPKRKKHATVEQVNAIESDLLSIVDDQIDMHNDIQRLEDRIDNIKAGDGSSHDSPKWIYAGKTSTEGRYWYLYGPSLNTCKRAYGPRARVAEAIEMKTAMHTGTFNYETDVIPGGAVAFNPSGLEGSGNPNLKLDTTFGVNISYRHSHLAIRELGQIGAVGSGDEYPIEFACSVPVS